MTADLHQGPLAPAPAIAPAARKTGREKRRERHRRRVWLEEVAGWILVPIIVVGAYWFIDAVLGALGTSPSAIISGLSAIAAGH